MKHEVCELAPELPPILPKVSPIVSIDSRGPVDSLIFQKTRNSEQETFGSRTFCAKQLKFGSLSKHQEWNLIELVAEGNSKGLEQGFVHAMSNRSPLELLSLSLRSDTSSRLDEGIDCVSREPSERSATAARMRNRGIDLQLISCALQMNLYDFPILCSPREMPGGAFMEEQVEDDSIKCRILRVSVAVPLCDMHVQFDIALENLFPVHSDGRVNEIRAGFAIPKSELDDLNERTSDCAEGGPKRA